MKLIVFLLVAGHALAQAPHDHAAMMAHNHGGENEAGRFLMEQASGTSLNPKSWMMPMVAAKTGQWNWMFMGQGFLIDTQQSGPRGGDKFYSPNWFMASTARPVGKGSVMIQWMGSLDPLTITQRRYPLLFQTGETAFGKPIVDAQHPHELIMGLGIHYARPLAGKTMFQVYFAPVGEPALGPVAFPHRASAAELPQATLGHHWQDSTHIANEVITAGISRGMFRLEASGFHGAEPNENRWNIDYGAIDSWSSRLSFTPSKNWLAQVSMGRLKNPERLEETDVVRSTASLHYTSGGWSSSLIWGRNHKTAADHGPNTNSYALESVAPVGRKNFVTGRIELADKDELQLGHGSSYRIGAYTAGYTRDVDLIRFVQTGVGANFTAYTLPQALKPFYGDHPYGVNLYVRFRLRSPQ